MSKAKYTDPKKLEAKIKRYFDQCEKRDKPATVAGLAFHLGFASRQSIHDYSNRDNEIGHVIRRARLRILQDIEERLLEGKRNPVGNIFTSKNMGNDSFADRQEVQHDNNITITFERPEGGLVAKYQTMTDEEARRIIEQQSNLGRIASVNDTPTIELEAEQPEMIDRK